MYPKIYTPSWMAQQYWLYWTMLNDPSLKSITVHPDSGRIGSHKYIFKESLVTWKSSNDNMKWREWGSSTFIYWFKIVIKHLLFWLNAGNTAGVSAETCPYGGQQSGGYENFLEEQGPGVSAVVFPRAYRCCVRFIAALYNSLLSSIRLCGYAAVCYPFSSRWAFWLLSVWGHYE